ALCSSACLVSLSSLPRSWDSLISAKEHAFAGPEDKCCMQCSALAALYLSELFSCASAGRSACLIFFFSLLPPMQVSRCMDTSGRSLICDRSTIGGVSLCQGKSSPGKLLPAATSL